MILIISLLIGAFSVDWFMLGEIAMGVVKVLTAGGCGIITVVVWFTVMKKDNIVFMGVAAAALILQWSGIRICPVYALFHVPCRGCSCTRALVMLVRGSFGMSWKYNPPVISLLIVCVILYPFRFSMDKWISEHPVHVFVLAAFAAVLLEANNLNNPLLR